MEDDEQTARKMEGMQIDNGAVNGVGIKTEGDSILSIDVKENGSQSPATSLDGIKSRGNGADTPTGSKPPRLSRKASQKLASRDPVLYAHLQDATSESTQAFQIISDCLYGSKHLGSTDNDAFDCDCREEWQDGENVACGEYSDCINRATKMECSATSGNCGGGCHNQRFQRKQYADVSVVKTEKKGFGLRANSDLHANDFIFEYIGEVINEPTFRRRMLQYDQEGIKHFYFMSLNKNEFVDATRKGNLGRFCNHSCNPNCYVDKWVIGDKLRMGIFALRNVVAGEELVFNYNVDRYGAEPQPCYCGEPNCVGFIGGKTQTERATKLPAATVEALGIDAGDGWDTTVAKKPRKRRPEEEDEDYVNSIQPRGLDEDDSRKVMAALMQCKEKWIAVKLLERIQRCDEERVVHSVMRMHAYQILKTTLNTFIDDHNVVLQVLSILDKFPRLTRNKIQDSNIEATIEGLAQSEHEDVASKSKKLLEEWSKLEVAYRIRRRKFDPTAPTQNLYEDRRGQAREEEVAQATPKTASPLTIDAPKGPRNSTPQRNAAFFHNGPRPRRPFNAPLPLGWFAAKDARGNMYFYDKQGTTTWQRPTQPAGDGTPKAPSKAVQEQLMIQSIIDRVTKDSTPKQTSSQPTQALETPPRENKQEKWRSLPVDKQMKIYENTVFPPVKHVLDKFRHKLPKDELKRLGKDIAKKLVASDFKNGRVSDPSAALDEKQSRKIKKYVKDFLDRAVQKFEAHQKGKAPTNGQPQTSAGKATSSSGSAVHDTMAFPKSSTGSPAVKETAIGAEADDISLSDIDDAKSPGAADLKRKRDESNVDSTGATPSDSPDAKKLKDDPANEPSPPPPPPPPMGSSMEDPMTEEQQALREQEEALMRENEEAQRLDDEANHKQMEGAVKDVQKDMPAADISNTEGGDDRTVEEHSKTQKQEVLSH